MADEVATIIENRNLGGGIWRMRLMEPTIAATSAPGQFVMLACGPDLAPTLRRPFSIQRTRGDWFEVLYRVVGQGTALMAELEEGSPVKVLGPLGGTFTLPQPGERALLLGGGVGIPPMVAIADALEDSGHRDWQAYVGVSGESDRGCFVGFDDRWLDDARVVRATMDGSIGFEGHVVAAWLDRWERAGPPDSPVRVYACGPMVMLRAVAAAADDRDLPCEVSVETMMGCGMGACMSCVIENAEYGDGASRDSHSEARPKGRVQDGPDNADARDPARREGMSPYDRWLLACRKGPVFDARAVVLDEGSFLH